ncbi:MAG: AarF/UbiB family protein [Gemmatimonadota bacterium]|nr:AarF/UbiB family protein [Gemmatimonadota bacterium]
MGAIADPSNEDLLRARGFEIMRVTSPPGLLTRFAATYRHFLGLLFGGLAAYVRHERAEDTGRGAKFLLVRLLAVLSAPFVDRELRAQPFAVQFRRRLERLGPTYIKLGQILSLREDLLPKNITSELKSLLNQLPVVPLPVLVSIIEKDLRRPISELFLQIDTIPIGSASIGQTHRATTHEGDPVIIKVVKPGIRETLQRDAKLLGLLGSLAELIIPRFQPKQLVTEFCEYTLREVDLRREADNAETFAANFADTPDVVFPEIYRDLSGRSILTMEFFDGIRPDSETAQALPEEERRHLTDRGAESIIRMLYRDGFFHADLHPGNLMILPGPKLGFIDLGMVGRLDEDLRRGLLYYYFALVMGDADNSARYLAAIAKPGPGANPAAFRREAAEIANRWKRTSTFEGYSLGQLILDSLSRGAQYGMYFPVELVLMVKALVTFEGVGHVLLPGFDVAEVSKRHIRALFIQQFSPLRLLTEGMRGAPDMVDAMAKMPLLVTDGLRVLERVARTPSENPLSGLRGTLIAGSCLVAGAISMGFAAPWPVWGGLFVIAFFLAIRRS